MDFPQHQSFEELRKFTDKYMKVMTALDRHRKGVRSQAPVRLVDNFNINGEEDGYAIDGADEDDANFVYPALDGLASTSGSKSWLVCARRVSPQQVEAQEVVSSDTRADAASRSCRMALPE